MVENFKTCGNLKKQISGMNDLFINAETGICSDFYLM